MFLGHIFFLILSNSTLTRNILEMEHKKNENNNILMFVNYPLSVTMLQTQYLMRYKAEDDEDEDEYYDEDSRRTSNKIKQDKKL